jgi:thiol-disulfide isomerase/thioredoxin
MNRLALLLLLAVAAAAQHGLSPKEDADLQLALSEAGNSPLEFSRALEAHLSKYPNSPQKVELERALAKAAVENKDNARLIRYGQRVLEREPDDIDILEKVTRALLATDDKDHAARALKYAKKLEEVLLPLDASGDGSKHWRLRQDLAERMGKALVYHARATGNLGNFDEAAALSRNSFETFPTAEAAREAGRWLARREQWRDAVERYADAFTIADPKATEAEKAVDRQRLAEIWRKTHPDETGLGDRILAAYDRSAAALEKYRAGLREVDPNAMVSNPMEFTLTGLKGEKLPLASLKGKVVVMDFWATWCGPCHAQYPLYEQAKKRFASRKDVVFLAISTDEDRAAVPQFLEKVRWQKSVYYEDGLSNLLRVSSIPTTIIFNKRGDLAARMNGFIADRFVDMLSARIMQALED